MPLVETLSKKRCRFSLMFAQLIIYANELGYEAAIDQVKRSELEASNNAANGSGIRNSNHIHGLAGDLLLYRDGSYLRATADHMQLGQFWESLSEDARWGGRFGDGNHYSLEHNGIK